MRVWLRTSSIALTAAVLAGAACGGADSIGSPSPERCGPIYCGSRADPEVPDGPSLCAPSVSPKVCNYQTQEGCAAGEACRPAIDNKAGTVIPACTDVGSQAAGEICDADRHCVRGAHCIMEAAEVAEVDGGVPTGTCRKLCCGGDWTACDPGESCIRQINVKFIDPGPPTIGPHHGEVVYAGVDRCAPVGNCDVLDPDACAAEGRACRIVNPNTVACTPRGTLAVGEECADVNQCGPGMHCVADAVAMTPPTCRRFCPWGPCVASGCAKGEECVHFPNDPAGVGECTPDWHGLPASPDAGGCL